MNPIVDKLYVIVLNVPEGAHHPQQSCPIKSSLNAQMVCHGREIEENCPFHSKYSRIFVFFDLQNHRGNIFRSIGRNQNRFEAD